MSADPDSSSRSQMHIENAPTTVSKGAEAAIVGGDAHETGMPAPDWLDDDGAQHRRFVYHKQHKTRRIDSFLHQRLKRVSRTRVQKLIAFGGVTVNGRVPKASTNIRVGDVVDVILPPPAVRQIKAEPIPLTVLYEDDDLLVLNKQAGILVHPARGNLSGTLLNAMAHHFQQQAAQPPGDVVGKGRVDGLSGVGAEQYRPGIVHRLDRNTTGVMVVAKSDEAHWKLARQFERREPLKAYMAVVHGHVDEVAGVVEQPVGRHPTIREAHAVRYDRLGKQSVTLFRVRERYRGYTLVECELKSGRTHQIRVHMTYLGHPLVGDLLYGGDAVGLAELDQPPIPPGARKLLTYARNRQEGERAEAAASKRDDVIIAHPALHATVLQFAHPITEQMMRFTAPLHEPARTLVRELRRRPGDGALAKYDCVIDVEAALE